MAELQVPEENPSSTLTVGDLVPLEVSPAQPMSPVPSTGVQVSLPDPVPPASSLSQPAPAVNVTTVVNGPTIVIANQQSGPGFFARAIWFIFVGWWLTGLWILVGWALLLTVIGIPVGLMMLNRVPKILTLKPTRTNLSVTVEGGVTTISQVAVKQHPLWLRALYFVLVGWWASLLWLSLAYLISLTILGFPIAFLMFDLSPAIITLRKQ